VNKKVQSEKRRTEGGDWNHKSFCFHLYPSFPLLHYSAILLYSNIPAFQDILPMHKALQQAGGVSAFLTALLSAFTLRKINPGNT